MTPEDKMLIRALWQERTRMKELLYKTEAKASSMRRDLRQLSCVSIARKFDITAKEVKKVIQCNNGI